MNVSLESPRPAQPRLNANFALTSLALAVLCTFSQPLSALPIAGEVASGNATISSTSPSNLTITQTSQNAVLNWQSFNIAGGQSVQFIQPSSSAVALNRVLGADTSSIFGSLTANGKVFLVNPNGVLFGPSASVNVGGLVASTMDISNADFLAGRYRFAGTGSGEIRNLGSIRSDDGGYVVLFGNQVSNEGTIAARLGSIALAAGSAMTLGIAADGLINVAVDQKSLHALASNSGLLQADGGQIFLSARAKDAMLEQVVNTTGIVQANSIGLRNGRVLLDGGDSGVVHVDGEVRAAGTAVTTTGGTIIAMGDKILVDDQARLDATGVSGGGNIYVGGGWQGTDPAIRKASAVFVARTATMDASATQSGDGGTVVAWSDIHNPQSTTRVYGTLLARAGSAGGNGGRIETSGKWIDVAGLRADASAPLGRAGMWLLDPDDLTISAAASTTPVGPPGFFAPAGFGPANVQNTDINANLNAGTTVVLTTASGGVGAGNISINAPISKTAGAAARLGFFADGSITLAPGIGISSSVGTLDVTLNAVNGIVLGAGSSIASNGGEIILSGATLTNNSGPGALLPGAGRWLIFSNDPATNVFGGLVSTNQAIWGQNLGSLQPGAVPAGNNFIFASSGATTSQVGALSVAWRVGERTGQLEIQAAEIDPELWIVQEPQATGTSINVAGAAGASGARANALSSAGPASSGGSTSTSTTSSSTAAAPPPTKLSASGFVGVANPGLAPSSRAASGVNQPVVLAGIDRAAIVGATGGGAAVIAAQARGGTNVRLSVTVAPNDSFEISLPPNLLGVPNGKGNTSQVEAVSLVTPLPDWIVFDRSSMKFSAVRVPAAGALPVTVRLRGASGKSVEVTFQ